MFRKIAVVALATALAVALPSPARAHGQLAFSDPADQTTVTDARDRVTLYFTERASSVAFFSVTAPDGTRVDHGWSGGEPKPLEKPVTELTLRDGKWEPQEYRIGFPTVVAVSHWPQRGVYTIRYLSLASDSDKVSGEIRFDYQGPVSAAPADWQAPTSQPDPALLGQSAPSAAAAPTGAPAPAPADGGTSWPYWLIGGLIVVAGAGYLVLRPRPRPGGRPRTRR
ncbi:copper resistance protein CopC [Catellatospora sp. KI3]|uniref:copper resistance CopC family protein n=1 Tax=Catellatospora sp. KI3 TaxID=3041620 RepID=UPI00248302FB|nr:copper resistance protein CopC [Catellatospora sp. KI3]MDI1464692.1 copper resistance protein CopC [Catellatospora sp. KI3]